MLEAEIEQRVELPVFMMKDTVEPLIAATTIQWPPPE